MHVSIGRENEKVKKFRNEFNQWQHNSREAVKNGLSYINEKNFKENLLYTNVLKASIHQNTPLKGVPPSIRVSTFNVHSPVNTILDSLKSLKRHIVAIGNIDEENPETNNFKIKVLSQICDKFTTVSKELIDYRYGSGKRSTITMNDEYDVQDLFRSLLHLFFDEVIPEEYSPSYAGGKSRIDFNLPNEKIIVEIKLASKKIRDKEIGEQLIIDNTRYQVKDNWNPFFLLCL